MELTKTDVAKIIIANNKYDQFDTHKELFESLDVSYEELVKLGYTHEETIEIYCELLGFDAIDDMINDIGNFMEYIENR